ncbi:glutaredoxin family protein [bacterium]|nr:glutaredoxin family protein [bacterium]
MLSVVIYSTKNCPFCVAAKALLESLRIQFDEIDLTNDIEKRLEISSKYNWRTVPMIIINDNFVGGFDELNNLYSEGKLEELL